MLDRKLGTGELSSAKSQRTWADVQDLHLIQHFGEWYVDAIRRSDNEDWRTKLGHKVQKGKYSPNTVNGWLRILLATLRAAVIELELEYDPARGIKPLDTSTHHRYTEEEPNSLTVAEVPAFMASAWKLYPQHFAMLALGLSTGRRPSELRPLRRQGPTPDVLWGEGILLVRRSETMGKVRESTKTDRRLRIPLPKCLVDILKGHVAQLPEGKMRESDLLFPSLDGKFRAASVLDKPIRQIAKDAKIEKHLSSYFMRRTFNDLCRPAQIHDFVTHSISGHATAQMQEHYSTVDGDEVRSGLAKVISLAGVRAFPPTGGDRGGDQPTETKEAA